MTNLKLACAGFACFTAMACSGPAFAQGKHQVTTWLTTANRSQLFRLQPQAVAFSPVAGGHPAIAVDDTQQFQPIDGFGFALTGGSAQHIAHMSPAARKALLQELFGVGSSQIGISYLRLSIGASDLNDHVFSYDDPPPGQTDTAMRYFDLGPDKENVIPVLKEILAIQPAIKILASPWSPPAWMKNNHDTRGGRLIPVYYPAYAQYMVRYIQAMKGAGIAIDAITVQNEPLHPGNNPSLLLTAPDEAEFISDYLGPAFTRAGITAKIIIYDHNADRPDYPIFILDNPAAKKYIDGSGFHLYGGNITALTDVHNAHPDRNIYFTEQMVVDAGRQGALYPGYFPIAHPVSRLIIGATRNWSRNVLEWNLAADSRFEPYTDRGGCSVCQGAVTIEGDSVSRNLAYYSIAHASKWVRPGSIRIASTEIPDIPNVAFKTPSGKIVLIVANTGTSARVFDIRYHNRYASLLLESGAAATYLWD